jgi:hypothetical protein
MKSDDGQRIKAELLRACEGCPPRISGREAKRRIESLIRKAECSVDALRDFWSAPEENLGPFPELPETFQAALADAAFLYHQEGNFRSSGRLQWWARSPVYRLGCRLRHRGVRWSAASKEGRLPDAAGKFFYLWGRRLTMAHDRVVRSGVRATRYTILSRTSFIRALWDYAEVDSDELIFRYVSNIPIDPGYGPVFNTRSKRVASCALSGLDLLISADGIYFVESNFNAGFRTSRLEVFPGGDPVAIKLFDYAATCGYSRIVFFPFSRKAFFPQELEAAWRDIAERHGISFEIREEPAFTAPHREFCEATIDLEADGTLYVSGRSWDSPLKSLIREKGRLDEEIERYTSRFPERVQVRLPKRVYGDAELTSYDGTSRFPNLIVKNALMDEATGIALYKTDRIPETANAWPNLAYQYVRPDCVTRSDGPQESDYVFIYRAYVLITPDGPVYLGARKDISATAVPTTLATGKVDDISPYIVNLNLEDIATQPEPSEDEKVKEAVLQIGAVVDDYLNRKHRLVIDADEVPVTVG